MSLFRAIREGIVRAGSAPALLALLWAVNLLVALPFAATLAGSIDDSVEPPGRPAGPRRRLRPGVVRRIRGRRRRARPAASSRPSGPGSSAPERS